MSSTTHADPANPVNQQTTALLALPVEFSSHAAHVDQVTQPVCRTPVKHTTTVILIAVPRRVILVVDLILALPLTVTAVVILAVIGDVLHAMDLTVAGVEKEFFL